jgi:hypothetical protein
MNTELFMAVLLALVAYRFLVPLIDRVNPLTLCAGRVAFRANKRWLASARYRGYGGKQSVHD